MAGMTAAVILSSYHSSSASAQTNNLNGQNLSGQNFERRRLDGYDFSNAVLRGASFRNAVARRANFSAADLRGTDFFGADLSGADLRGAIGPVVLRGTNAPGANLAGLEIRASLEGANLAGADLRGTDLSETLLTGSMLAALQATAITDTATRWPAQTLAETPVEPARPPQLVEAVPDTVIERGNRTILRNGNSAIILHDDTDRLRTLYGPPRIEQRGEFRHVIQRRPDGLEIVSVLGVDGQLIYRLRRRPDGTETILIDNRIESRRGSQRLSIDAPAINIAADKYIVELDRASERDLITALEAPPLVRIERAYSLTEIYRNKALRDRMRSVNIDTITFDFASWTLSSDDAARLAGIASAMRAVLARKPNEVFLIEGHTDAIGTDEDNLTLSDRRAETVATVLSQRFGLPAENMVTQGYGAHYLKIDTPDAERRNRRATVRRITPLLLSRAAQ